MKIPTKTLPGGLLSALFLPLFLVVSHNASAMEMKEHPSDDNSSLVNHFSKLPTEVIKSHVIPSLTTIENGKFLLNLSEVNKYLFTITQEARSNLRKMFQAIYDEEDAQWYLRNYPQLQTTYWYIKNNEIIPTLSKSVLKKMFPGKFPAVSAICFEGVPLTFSGLEYIIEKGKEKSTVSPLLSIRLKDCHNSRDDIASLLLSELSYLRYFYLINCSGLLADNLVNLPQTLRELAIENINMSDELFISICTIKTIDRLSLRGCANITMENLHQLFIDLPALATLDVRDNEFTETDIEGVMSEVISTKSIRINDPDNTERSVVVYGLKQDVL